MAHMFLMPIITFNPFSAVNFYKTTTLEDKMKNLIKWNKTQENQIMVIIQSHNQLIEELNKQNKKTLAIFQVIEDMVREIEELKKEITELKSHM